MTMADLGSIDLPSFSDIKDEPKLMPKLSETGPVQTSEGLNNFNAEPFFQPAPKTVRMNDEHILKEKYEILRKFDRLSKLGVPMRKRFTLDSPIDEMKMELEFIRREKAMDQTIKQFCDWYITGMSALEWSSKNVAVMQAFGLNLSGLSESAQMNVADMEEDFEELYDLYGDKLKMHPLVRIPIRTCMMVYMVHLTNQMAQKSPIPNIDQILKTNPDIARQMAAQAMQNQTQQFRQQAQTNQQQQSMSVPMFPSANGFGNSAPQPQQDNNPLAGLMSFLGGVNSPPPPTQATRTIPIKPVREMKSPSGMGIGDILNKIQKEERKVGNVSAPPPPPQMFQPPPAPIATSGPPPPPRPMPAKSALRKSAGSERKSAKNSVVIKL